MTDYIDGSRLPSSPVSRPSRLPSSVVSRPLPSAPVRVRLPSSVFRPVFRLPSGLPSSVRPSVFRPAFRLPSGLPSFHAFRLPVSPSLVFHRRPAVQPTTAYCCPLHLRITPGQSIYILPHTYASTTLKLRQPRVQPELDLALCAVSVFPSVPSPVSRLPSPVFRLPSSVPSSVFRPLPSAPVRSRPGPSPIFSRLPSSVHPSLEHIARLCMS